MHRLMKILDVEAQEWWSEIAREELWQQAASHSFIAHVVDVQMAEAYALKQGFMLAEHVGALIN